MKGIIIGRMYEYVSIAARLDRLRRKDGDLSYTDGLHYCRFTVFQVEIPAGISHLLTRGCWKFGNCSCIHCCKALQALIELQGLKGSERK